MAHNTLPDDTLPTPSTAVSDDAMTTSMVRNLADWHDESLRPFGIQTFQTGSLWWRQPGGSGIYLGAMLLDNQTPDEELLAEFEQMRPQWAGQEFALYESWASRDLSKGGFELLWKNPWYLCPPLGESISRLPHDLPEGFTIERAATAQQLADFERATWEGFEEPADPEAAFRERKQFSQHPLATLDCTNMVYLNGRFNGQVVASVIFHITADMVGIYGLSTLPNFRRRGYAAALIYAGMKLRPDLPVSVYPDPDSVPIYTRVGYRPAGEIAVWKKSA